MIRQNVDPQVVLLEDLPSYNSRLPGLSLHANAMVSVRWNLARGHGYWESQGVTIESTPLKTRPVRVRFTTERGYWDNLEDPTPQIPNTPTFPLRIEEEPQVPQAYETLVEGPVVEIGDLTSTEPLKERLTQEDFAVIEKLRKHQRVLLIDQLMTAKKLADPMADYRYGEGPESLEQKLDTKNYRQIDINTAPSTLLGGISSTSEVELY